MDTGRVDCLKCKHFVITWNPKFPRACNAYGFKTMSYPSAEVFKATGEECLAFEKKEVKKR